MTMVPKMTLTSKQYAVDDMAAAQEFFHSRGWTDGLPVVPPTPDAVQACLDWVAMPADQLIGIEPVRERAVTAEKLAVNAVMAGCLPMHFPVVVAAFTAMLQEPFLLYGATASTGGCAVLIVVNGPVRTETGMDGTFNALAASDRASTAIGRAIRLVLCNLLDVRPGDIDRSTLGHPGKLSYCIAEDEEHSPWLPLAEERGVPEGASAVTVMAAGAPRQLMNEWTTKPEEILETFVAEMKANMRHYSIWPGTTPSWCRRSSGRISRRRDGPRPTSAATSSITPASGAGTGRSAARAPWSATAATGSTPRSPARTICW